MKKAIEAAATIPLETDDSGAAARTFRFDPDFPGFAGHFPEYPIVPAIVQILAAQTVIEGCHGGPLRLSAVEGAKFLKQVTPGQEIRVVCRPRAGAPMAYQAKLCAGTDTAATFMLRFEPVGEGNA
jgi:3-hydroxyacyl-[acyl-carrier-protein] dehydratase